MGGTPVLETVRAGVTFVPAAASSFRRLEARLGRRADVNRTYADYATQLRMYNAWNAYAAGKGPYPGHSRALHPDDSVHCQGLAWDTDDWRTPGFIALAAEYGWIRTAAGDPTEQHHFEYQWWRDQHRNEPVPTSGRAAAPPQEEDDMLMLNVKMGDRTHKCALGPGIFRHFVGGDPYDHIMRLARFDDQWQPLDASQLPAALRTYGCDLHIWDVRGGEFVVLDPLDGSVKSGNVWSAVNAARSTLAQVKVTSEQTAAYVKTLTD